MKLSLRFVCVALVIAALGFVFSTNVIPSHAATSPATIQTDQKHYSVGATMGISGSGFSSGVSITLTVVRPDQLTDVVPGVSTDSSGSFHATYTPPLEPGRYKFTATDGTVSATTASTEADAIGFNKAVYRKADTTYAGGAGTWTTGEAGSNYVENQWAFYQYQPTGFTSAIPDFDVQFNYHEASSGAIFVDAFANFRACVTAYKSNGQIIAPNNCEDTDSSGLLSDGHHAPTTATTHWIDAHTAISNINHSISADGSSCLATADAVDTIANDTHCFHVNGTTLRTLLLAADPNVFSVPTADNYAVSLYYAAHLAATAVWHPFSGTTGNEALLGCYGNGNYVVHTLGTNFTGAGTEFVPAPAPAVAGVPVGTYGTDVYDPDLDPCDTPVVGEDFTVKAFLGIGSASGASRHFTLANPQIGGVSVGSQGAITLPIPSVAAPTGTITIVKVTTPANSGAATFSFGGDLGSFVLDTNSADATNPSSKTIINVPGGESYTVTETEPSGWSPAGNAVCVNNTGTSAFSTTGTSATIDFADTANAAVTCTFTNNGAGHLVVDKVTNPSGDPTSFSFTTTGTGYSGFSLTDAATPNDQTLSAGTYTVAETATAGWTLTNLACAETVAGAGGSTFPSGPTTTQPASITLAVGATITCTFTNTKNASLAIQKTVVGAGTTFSYGVTGSGLSAFTRTPADNSTTAAASFPFDGTQLGDKYVTETVPSGYTLTNIVCTANGATIVIGAGQGGAFVPGTSAGFDAGDTTVKVTVGAGNSPTCTFTNTQNSSLAIQKTVVGAGTTFSYGVTGSGLSAFTRTPADNSTTAAAAFPFDGTQLGDKYVTETVPTGYTLTNIVCTANGATILIGTGQGAAFAQGTSAGFDAGDTTVKVTVHAGDTPTCTFTNTQTASLAIQKSTVGGVGSFTYSISGSGLSGFTRNTGTQGNPTTTTAFSLDGTQLGDKYVTETVPAGWALTNIACTANGATILIGTGQGAAFAQGSSAGFDAGDTTVKVTVGAGNSPTCTFTNTKLATLVVTKTTVGGIGSFNYSGTNTVSFTLATTVAGAAGKVSTSAATVPTFSNITPGTVKNVIEAVPTGWALAGQPTCAITTTGTGSSTSAANTAAGVTVTLGAGDTVTCNFVNDLLPTLTINKTVQGTGTGTFSFDVTGANTLNSGTIPSTNITPASAPATASFGPYTINTGTSVISEHTPLPAGDWTLTDATCTGYTPGTAGDGPGTLDVNGVATNWTFTAQFGNNIVCSYVNNNAQASRTQGFWATHTTLSNNIWNGTNLPAGATKAGDGIDNFFSGGACGAGFTITADPTTVENILMGGFWSNISQKTTNPKNRTSIDQTRMQMIQQYLAAVLNYHMFGSIGETVLANARTAYCGTSQSAIQGFIGTLGNLNQSGDQLGATPGGSATTQVSKSQADIDAWDTPTHPVD